VNNVCLFTVEIGIFSVLCESNTFTHTRESDTSAFMLNIII